MLAFSASLCLCLLLGGILMVAGCSYSPVILSAGAGFFSKGAGFFSKEAGSASEDVTLFSEE